MKRPNGRVIRISPKFWDNLAYFVVIVIASAPWCVGVLYLLITFLELVFGG